MSTDRNGIAIAPSDIGPAGAATPGRRTTITQERYFEKLEGIAPGISVKISAFIDRIGEYSVSTEFGTASMILRWHSNDSKSWNLATIPTTGLLWLDYLGQETKNAGLLDLHSQYLSRLAALVPTASVKKTPQQSAWYVTLDGKAIRIDALLADEARMEGWIGAITEFQAAVIKSSQGS